MSESLLQAALDLAARGLPVFQCNSVRRSGDGTLVCTCGKPTCRRDAGKHPHPQYARNGFHNATTAEHVIRAQWGRIPWANIGLATAGLVVLDIDPRHEGDQSLVQLEQRYGLLPATWRAFTGGGGEHIYFRAPAGARIPSSNDGKLGRGIDVRALSGYVLAPPSLHVSGRRYCWNVDFHPDEIPLAEPPDWIVATLTERPTPVAKANDWLKIARDGVEEGSRNSTIAKLSGHLLRRYVDAHVTLELMMALNAARFRPPLDDDEVRKIVGSISKAERSRREARDGRR